jgi:hypothetical protein
MRRLPARWLGASASPVTTAGCVARLHERFGLRPGLSVADAGDILWALTAPELTLRLVHRRRWSVDKYEVWLAKAMVDALLAPPGRDQVPSGRSGIGEQV